MSDRRQEFRVGVVALASVMTATLLVALNTGTTLRFGAAPYELLIRVDRAPGVGPNTPVQKDGVLIGRVTATEFLEGGGVLVRANILPDAPVYQGDACRIQPSSLFGDAVINFSFTGAQGGAVKLEPGSQVMGQALPDPIGALTSLQVEFAPAIKSIGDAADGVARLTDKVNSALGEDFGTDETRTLIAQAKQSFVRFDQTMADMSHTLSAIDNIVEDPEMQMNIKQVLADVPVLLADARDTVIKAQGTLDSFGGVVQSAQENLVNLEGLTKPLGDRGPQLAAEITGAVGSLDAALADLGKFATALNSSNGTIARLVNDPTLYDNVATVVANANSVIVRINDLVKELRPIVYDVRVFSDKIAREPGRIVGGALNKGPGIK